MEPGQSNALALGKAKVSDADDHMTDVYTDEAPEFLAPQGPEQAHQSSHQGPEQHRSPTSTHDGASRSRQLPFQTAVSFEEIIQFIFAKARLAAAICADMEQVAQDIHKLREADQSIHRFNQTVNIERLLYHKERLDILVIALREQSISIEQRFPTIKTTPERLVRDWYAAIADSWQAGIELKDELDAIAMEEITHGLGRI